MRLEPVILSALLLAVSCGGQAVTSAAGAGDQGDSGTGADATAPADAGLPDSAPLADAAGGDAAVPVDAAVPGAGQKVLFDVSYVNYAWGAAINGYYVTREGDVYGYDYVAEYGPDAPPPYLDWSTAMTEAQVTQKYGTQSKLVGHIEAGELALRFGLVAEAQQGALLPQSMCADFGQITYAAYRYDDTTARYTPVLLGTDGDMALKNTAPDAETLIEFLRTAAGEQGERVCAFVERPCFGELCPGTAPCEEGTVPMDPTGDGCMSYCGMVTWCASVPDCGTCAAAGDACVVDGAGVARCVGWVPGCAGVPECGCGGAGLCAGGAPYCHGTAEGGITCY